MSGDLISRDKFMEDLNSYKFDTRNDSLRRAEHHVKALVFDLIKRQKTAYDLEKVIQQLEERIELCNSEMNNMKPVRNMQEQDSFERIYDLREGVEFALKIVKSGGIDDGGR